MASFIIQFSFFFILLITILSSSHHIHARDSQFFSKVTNPNTNNIPNQNEIKSLNKEDLPLKNNEQVDPNFIPQGQDGGYGLYGHESGQLPPSTTTTTVVGDGSESKNMYNQEKQGMSDTRFMEKSYTTPIKSYEPENGGNKYYDENKAINQEKQVMKDTRNMEKKSYYTTPIDSFETETENGGKSFYNQEKQGMSDTRFMDKSYTTPINSYNQESNMFNQENQESSMYNQENQESNMYNQEDQENMYNQENQETGDARFMEKSYMTPINGEKMYNPEKQNEGTNLYNQEYNMYKQENQEMGGSRFMEKSYTTPINGEKMYNPEKRNQEYNMYNQENQEMGGSRFMEKSYTTPIKKQVMSDTRFMKNSFEYNNGDQMYNSEKQGMVNNVYNPEKQGMSDTRFLENGKYYYDLNTENSNTLNANDDSKGAEWKYEYNNNRGNYGNNVNSMEFQNEDDLP